MSKNLVINGVVFNGVDSIDVMTSDGNEVRYVEEEVVVPGATVAKIGDVEYDSVEKALSAAVSGDTVTMVADSEEERIVISEGVALDIAGHELTAQSIVSFGGDFRDSSNGGYGGYGKVYVPDSNFNLPESNSMVPMYDNGCYKITRVRFSNTTVASADGTFSFRVSAFIGGAPAYGQGDLSLNSLMTDGLDDNKAQIFTRTRFSRNSVEYELRMLFPKTALGAIVSGSASVNIEIGTGAENVEIALCAMSVASGVVSEKIISI